MGRGRVGVAHEIVAMWGSYRALVTMIATATYYATASVATNSRRLETSVCVQCDDVPMEPYMSNNGKTCATWSFAHTSKCASDSVWVANRYCARSCFENGNGYDAGGCCPYPSPPASPPGPLLPPAPPASPPAPPAAPPARHRVARGRRRPRCAPSAAAASPRTQRARARRRPRAPRPPPPCGRLRRPRGWRA